MGPLSMPELLVVLGIAVMLFGKRLPDVAKSVGKSFIEFKKGLRGIEDELRTATNTDSRSQPRFDDYRAPASSSSPAAETTVPKFELPSPPEPAFQPDAELQPHQD